jgi:hypothetical protein
MDSRVNRSWTREDDALLLHEFRRLGPKWVEIGKILHGRSGNTVKNRWHKHLKHSLAAMGLRSDSATPCEPATRSDTAKFPTIIETPTEDPARTIGISESHWEQMLASLEKDVPFDALWANAFSL